MTSYPAGPIFTATYNASDSSSSTTTTSTSNSSSSSDSGQQGIIQKVKNFFDGGMSKGAIAAAVIVPLLVIGLAIAAFIRYKRGKQADKRKRFSQAVDKRMSTISTDWRAMSGASANAAIRDSVRTSTFGGPGVRPVSTFSVVGGGQAGIGTRFGGLQTEEEPVPQMSQLRIPRTVAPGVSTERISRVSFAADSRFSVDSQGIQPPLPSPGSRLQATRSYHQGHSFDEQRDDVEDARELQMSPTQTQGPFALSAADINARASGDDDDFRREVLKMPAMTLMRTGHSSVGGSSSGAYGDELVLPGSPVTHSFASSPQQPSYPSPILKKNSMALPTAALSPDDMLRAYASGRATPVPVSVLGSGASTVSSGGNTGMRILYAPSSPSGAPSAGTTAVEGSGLSPVENNPFRKSMARTTMYTESMYSGMAEEDGEVYGSAK